MTDRLTKPEAPRRGDWRLPRSWRGDAGCAAPLTGWLLIRQVRADFPFATEPMDLWGTEGEPPVELLGLFPLRDLAAAAAPVTYRSWSPIYNDDTESVARIVGWMNFDDSGETRVEYRLLCISTAPDARAAFKPGQDPLFAAFTDPDGMARMVLERAVERGEAAGYDHDEATLALHELELDKEIR